MNKKILFTILFIFLSFFIAKEVQAIDISACSVLDQAGATYYLTADIIGSTAAKACMNITANNITLDCQGHAIDGIDTAGTYGINISRPSFAFTNITVKNCNITDWYTGIYLSNANNNSLANNTINSNTAYGIRLYSSSNNTLTNNTANNNGEIGFFIQSSSNNTLTNNTANNNGRGIHLLSSSNNTFTNNMLNSNSYGISLETSSDNTLVNNSIQASHTSSSKQQGLYILGSSISDFRNNINESNTVNNLPILYIDGVTRTCPNNATYTNGSSYSYMGFAGCNNITVRDSSPGNVLLASTVNSIVSNLNISFTKVAINLQAGANSNNIINNTANSNIDYSIYLVSSSNNILTNNTVNSNNYGIYLDSSSNNNTFTNNMLNSNTYGFRLWRSYNNTITDGSIISSDNDYWLYSASATNNFTNTNFTAARKIYFYDTTSWFNYRNESDGLWLKTTVSAQTTITRLLTKWSQSNMSWNESVSVATTATYNITGLLPNTIYNIYNFSILAYTITSDSTGNLNFTIALNTTIREIRTSAADTTPPTYSLNSTNSTSAGTPVEHSLKWTDNIGLSGYIFSTNNSGSWINDTWTWFPAITPDNSTLLLYHLNNESAYGENDTHVYDFSGNGNNGTVYGGGKPADGKIGGGFNFTTLSQYISYPFPNNTLTYPPFTYETWLYLRNQSDYPDIFKINQITSGAYRAAKIWSGEAQSSFYFEYANLSGTTIRLHNYISIPFYEWHHIAWVVNASNYSSLYKDGVLISSGQMDPVRAFSNIGYLGGPGTTINQVVDEVAVYNRSLTASEVKQHYLLFNQSWSNVTKTLNNNDAKIVSWKVYANDTSNNWNSTDNFILTLTGNEPKWSLNSTNNTLAAQPTLFSLKWTDAVGLSGYIFSTNNTGSWHNDSWNAFNQGYYGNQFNVWWNYYAINANNQSISFRFTAPNSKTINRIKFKMHTINSPPTFIAGIQADNGTGYPSETYLGSATFTPSSYQYVDLDIADVTLTQGSIYHMVIQYYSGTVGSSNGATFRYMPIDNNIIPLNGEQVSNFDTIYNSSAGWEVPNYDPILVLNFTDGTLWGQPYWDYSEYSVYGNNWIAENMTMDETKVLQPRVGVLVQRVGNPPNPLEVIISDNTTGSELSSGNIVNSSVETSMAWHTISLNQGFTLQSGNVILVKLKTVGGDASNYYKFRRAVAAGDNNLTWKGTNQVASTSSDGGGAWTNNDAHDIIFRFNSSEAWSNVTKTLNSTVGALVQWKVYANDTSNNWNASDIFSLVTTDPFPPTWSNNKTSPSSPTTYSSGASYQFNITWSDNVALDKALIEHNFTGSSTPHNESFTGSKNGEYYFDVSDLGAGTYVWRSYANDTSGNQNVTDIMTFTITSVEEEVAEVAAEIPFACTHTIRIIGVKDVEAKPGEKATAEITVQNTGCYDEKDIRVYIECLDGWGCESITIPELKRREIAIVSLEIKIPEEAEVRNYTFPVVVLDGWEKRSSLKIVVNPLCKSDYECGVNERCVDNRCTKLFDIEIVRADSPIEPGEFLDFAYLVKSMSNVSGDVKIDFWIEKDGKKIVEGSDTIYLATLEERVKTTSLYLYSDIDVGRYDFYVQVTHQDYKVYAYRPIEVGFEVPLVLDMSLSKLPEISSGEELEFTINLAFNKDRTVHLVLEEKVIKEKEVVWQKKHDLTINRSMSIKEEVIGLKPGYYILEVKANYENKTSSLLKSFNVKAIDYRYVILTVVVVAVVSCIVIVYSFYKSKYIS